jgi:hypothetical protein
MARQPVPDDPLCPLCREKVFPGDHVVFGHGEYIHLACHLGGSGAAQSLAAFLKRQAGLQFCHTCLSASLAIPYDDVRKAVTGVRMSRTFRVDAAGRCSICANERVTIRAQAPEDTSPGAFTNSPG